MRIINGKCFDPTPAFRQGDDPNNKTIILLSAPGRIEEKAGRPAAGRTGKTLQRIFDVLHESKPLVFTSVKLDDYTIANSITKVYYKSKNNRTEATDKEVCDTENIARLKKQLKGYDNIVVLGNKAKIAIQKIEFKGVIFKGNHPSCRSLVKKIQLKGN